MRLMRLVLVVVFVLAVGVGAVACAEDETPATTTPAETPAPADDEPAEEDSGSEDADSDTDPARVLVESKCSLCHTLDRVWSADYDRAVWEATVDRMKANGLVISDDEYETVVGYLAGE